MATFSFDEVVQILCTAGYVRGTIRFTNELGRRFKQIDTDAKEYVERDDWVPADSSSATASERHDVC